jgi:hypothetical protein
MKISTNSTIAVARDVLSCDLREEVAILNLNDEEYYVLNSLGARIWGLVQKPNTLENVLEELLKDYDVEKERLKQDLMELVNELVDKGLVEIK